MITRRPPPVWVQSAMLGLFWLAFGLLLVVGAIYSAAAGTIGAAAGALVSAQYLVEGRPLTFVPLAFGLGLFATGIGCAAWLLRQLAFCLEHWRGVAVATKPLVSNCWKPQTVVGGWLIVVGSTLASVATVGGLLAWCAGSLVVLVASAGAVDSLLRWERIAIARAALAVRLHQGAHPGLEAPGDE